MFKDKGGYSSSPLWCMEDFKLRHRKFSFTVAYGVLWYRSVVNIKIPGATGGRLFNSFKTFC